MKALGRGSLSSLLAALLDVAWYGTAAILVIFVVLLLVGASIGFQIDFNGPSVDAGPNAMMTLPAFVQLEAGAYRIAAPSLGIDGARLRDLQGVLAFPIPKTSVFLSTTAPGIGMLALALWALGQLRALFRTLRDGQPFVPANATRLRRIAWAVIAFELLRSGLVFFASYYAKTHFSAVGLSFDARFHLDVVAIINGLIILVIAEVFREGTRLDEDRSLTI